jgi:protein tyrosine/serine phosphatase
MFLERRTAKALGINLINWRCRSDHVVSVPRIQQLIELLRTIETPVLIHCKSGADRMGFVSVVYRHVIMGEPIETAMEQLSGKYLHIKSSKTGVLDHFFEVYARAHQNTGISFEDWLETECNPAAINGSFKPNGFAGWFERKILRRE